jgi:transcription-repair coupling factor (superfamily II helicase)
VDTISVPRPLTRRVGGEPLRDLPLLTWCADLITTLLDAPTAAPANS